MVPVMPTPQKLHRDSTGTPQPAASACEIRVRVPVEWLTELRTAAGSQGISVADLVRIVLRAFLRGRYQ
jgi:hypothetical protein